MRKFSKFLLLVVALISSQTFAQSDTRQLEELMADYWSYTLQESPTLATRAGINDFNHLLPQVSPVDHARRLRTEEAFQERLISIDRDSLNRDNQVNYDLLDWELARSIDGMRLNTLRIPFNFPVSSLGLCEQASVST